jgi:hypothetical protein
VLIRFVAVVGCEVISSDIVAVGPVVEGSSSPMAAKGALGPWGWPRRGLGASGAQDFGRALSHSSHYMNTY